MISEPVVGKRIRRLDAAAKVTGRAVYGMDFTLPGMLHGRILRSPHAHARILEIDTTEAASLPGVRAIVHAVHLSEHKFGLYVRDETLFASGVVRYIGQPIAAIAADTTEIAERALAMVEVKYQALPEIHSIEDTLRADAVLVHPEWGSYKTATNEMVRHSNLASKTILRKGDGERALAKADLVFEHHFETQMQHQGYIEPRTAIAEVDDVGRVTVWSNTQLPFTIQTQLSEILEVPPSRVRVIGTVIGGAFGGKLRLGMEPFAALLARHARRPVKVTASVEEDMIAAYPRHASIIELKTGVMRDGTIVAKVGRIIFDTGAFAGSGPTVASVATLVLAGPYNIPNLYIEGLAVYTNKTNLGSFRAPSGPQGVFATESQMDMIADALEIDPLQLRLKNIYHDGDIGPTGTVLRGVGLQEALEKVSATIGWDRPNEENEGKGIACSWWTTAGGSSGVYVKLNVDGTVVLNTGAPEIGTAAVMAGAAQLLADALTIPPENIEVVTPDTSSMPFDFGAAGSRTALSVGAAAQNAAQEIRQQLLAFASKEWDVPASALVLENGCVVMRDYPSQRLTMAQCAQASIQRGGGIVAHGTFIAPPTEYDKGSVVNHLYPTFNSPGFNAHAARVQVDRGTGEISVKHYVVAQDVGFAFNPTYIEGQIEGGVAQGIGQALMEEIVMKEGRVLNPNLTDYKMPTTMDVPPVESIILEYSTGSGPHGAKGVGEPPVLEPPAVIANAVARAVGVRITSLPITAEKVLKALHEPK